MVQIFDPTTSYPLSSVVEHRGGLYQKIASASFGSGEPVRSSTDSLQSPVHRRSDRQSTFSHSLQGDASGEWSFLGVDATGIATPEHALLSSATRSTARIFDQETEFDLIDAEEAQGEPSSQPGEQYPSSSTIDQLETIEATLEYQPDLLLAEAAGEHLFKSPRRGLWAYSGSSDPTLERLKEGIYQRVLGAERGDFQAGREAWRAAAVARREVDELPETREASKTLKWILIGPDDPFPRDALPLGAEKASAREEEPIFAARGYHKGAVEIGKVRRGNNTGDEIAGELMLSLLVLQCGPHLGRPRHSFALGDRELFFDKVIRVYLQTGSLILTPRMTDRLTLETTERIRGALRRRSARAMGVRPSWSVSSSVRNPRRGWKGRQWTVHRCRTRCPERVSFCPIRPCNSVHEFFAHRFSSGESTRGSGPSTLRPSSSATVERRSVPPFPKFKSRELYV